MLSIRLSRIGKKKQPHYRIVVMEKTRDPWADYVEKLGHYNPRTKELVLDKERAEYWLSQGAEATTAVHNMFVTEKLIKADKIAVSHITKKRKAKIDSAKTAEEEAKKATEEAAKQAEEEAKVVAEAPAEEAPEEKATEENTEEVIKEAVEEKVEETPAEEAK